MTSIAKYTVSSYSNWLHWSEPHTGGTLRYTPFYVGEQDILMIQWNGVYSSHKDCVYNFICMLYQPSTIHLCEQSTLALHNFVLETQPDSDLSYVYFTHSSTHSKNYNFVQRTWTQINTLQLLVVILSCLCHQDSRHSTQFKLPENFGEYSY